MQALFVGIAILAGIALGYWIRNASRETQQGLLGESNRKLRRISLPFGASWSRRRLTHPRSRDSNPWLGNARRQSRS